MRSFNTILAIVLSAALLYVGAASTQVDIDQKPVRYVSSLPDNGVIPGEVVVLVSGETPTLNIWDAENDSWIGVAGTSSSSIVGTVGTAAGSASAPAFYYNDADSLTTGFYWRSADNLSYAADGSEVLRLGGGGQFRAGNGSISSPSLSFMNDDDNGLYRLVDGLGMTAGGEDLGQWYVAAGTLSAAQVLALNGTPITVISAPGAGNAVSVESAQFHLDYGTTQYAGIGAGEDLTVLYVTDGSALMACDNATCLDADAAADDFGEVSLHGAAAGGATLSANDAIEIQMASGNWTTGDSPIRYLIRYRIVSTSLE